MEADPHCESPAQSRQTSHQQEINQGGHDNYEIDGHATINSSVKRSIAEFFVSQLTDIFHFTDKCTKCLRSVRMSPSHHSV